MGIAKNDLLSILLEILGMAFCIGVVFLGLIGNLLEEDPFSFLIIPLWGIVAYGAVLMGGVIFEEQSNRKPKNEAHVTQADEEATNTYYRELEELKKLKDKGIITEKEFAQKKKKILEI